MDNRDQVNRELEQKHPHRAARQWYIIYRRQPGRSKEVIEALKRLKAVKYLVEIVKSQKDGGQKDVTGLIDALEKANSSVWGLDDALEAIRELKDIPALRSIAEDESVLPHLREKAAQYLRDLEREA